MSATCLLLVYRHFAAYIVLRLTCLALMWLSMRWNVVVILSLELPLLLLKQHHCYHHQVMGHNGIGLRTKQCQELVPR